MSLIGSPPRSSATEAAAVSSAPSLQSDPNSACSTDDALVGVASTPPTNTLAEEHLPPSTVTIAAAATTA